MNGLLFLGRWVSALALRGLAGGATHGVLAAAISAAVQRDSDARAFIDVLGVFLAFGAVVGGMLATIIGLATAPAALWAAGRGDWGRLRAWVVGLPAAAIVTVALSVAPPWPTEPVDPSPLSDVVVGVVWLYAGPACWAAWFLYRVTGRWPPRPSASQQGDR